jgi:2-dehydropantoate 2-reductase
VLVVILAGQVDEKLTTTLKACHDSTTIMFMFNNFEPLQRFRDAFGTRFTAGFPAIMADFQPDDGSLVHMFVGWGQRTIVEHPTWQPIFADAGIPCDVEPDMESWLRTHAVLIAGMLGALLPASARRSGASWAESTNIARMMNEGFALVRTLGNNVIPKLFSYMDAVPTFVLASLIWTATHTPYMLNRAIAVPGMKTELVGLLDSMIALAPSPQDVPLITQLRAVLQPLSQQ